MLGRTDRPLRLVCLFVALAVLAGALGVRLAYWQVARAGDLRELALLQSQEATRVPAQRGEIQDRHGGVLATTAYRDLLAAYPDRIPDGRREAVATRLVRILGLKGEPARKLRADLAGGRPYVVLDMELTPEQSLAVRSGVADGSLAGLELQPRPIRVYPSIGGAPDTTLASHLLGFVDARGAGQYGIEQRYQAALGGRPQMTLATRDIAGRPRADSTQVIDPGSPGSDVRLTLDASLQLRIEKELYAAWVADGATSVSAVVMDPYTGEILAWGTAPGYDANRYQPVASRTPGVFLDPNVSKVYEPGSVMKMLVAAAGYEHGVVDRRTIVNDSGTLRIGRLRVDDADKKAMGRIRFQDVIAYSRNVGSARVAFRLGRDTETAATRLYEMWRRLGFGARTGVDVAGELPGLVDDPRVDPWERIDLANRSFGQGMAATPIQLATAFSAMVNGGYRVQPRAVSAVAGEAVAARGPVKVLQPKVAAELRRLLVHVVTRVPVYADGTLIPGHTVGGKTGTAQIWDTRRRAWVGDTFNFSFVGFVGAPRARAVIAVQIHRAKPRIRAQGRFELPITSYQLFRRLALATIDVLEIPPDRPVEQPRRPRP